MPPTIGSDPVDIKLGDDDVRTFKVRLRQRQRLRLLDLSCRPDTGPYEKSYIACETALVGWDGVTKDGAAVKFGVDMDANLRALSADDIFRLSVQILEGADLTETDRKN